MLLQNPAKRKSHLTPESEITNLKEVPVTFLTSQRALFVMSQKRTFPVSVPLKIKILQYILQNVIFELNLMQRFQPYTILLCEYVHILLLPSICCALLHRECASHTSLQAFFCCHPLSFWFDQDRRKNIFLVNFFFNLFISVSRGALCFFFSTAVILPAAAPHGSTFLRELWTDITQCRCSPRNTSWRVSTRCS